ncbi:GatB/YqeY domain-containing protein [Pueribacillus sp. YX66]|uniref:GatB/YqeY domain-containing protein n=1 Tax=Pueribacillus sp. YX66 TaxID=3229242 RepID=UPI00358D0F56
MSLDNLLLEDMKQAMKNKDKTKLAVIRLVRSALQNEAIKRNGALSEDDEIAVLSRELKQRKDSLQEFKKAGRDDLVEGVISEIKVLEAYLPKQLTTEELEAIVKETIAEIGASSKKEFGKVMGAIMPKVKGKADGNIVNQLVQKHLS